jgi:hypothetical protein
VPRNHLDWFSGYLTGRTSFHPLAALDLFAIATSTRAIATSASESRFNDPVTDR